MNIKYKIMIVASIVALLSSCNSNSEEVSVPYMQYVTEGKIFADRSHVVITFKTKNGADCVMVDGNHPYAGPALSCNWSK